MNTGYLTVEVSTADGSLPVANALVIIRQPNGSVLFQTNTDANGKTGYFSLPAPDYKLTLDPTYTQPAYSVYDVDVSASGFVSSHIHDVEVVDTQIAILPVALEPLADEPNPVTDIDINIPPVALLSTEEKKHFDLGYLSGFSEAALPVVAEGLAPQQPQAVPAQTPFSGSGSSRVVIIPDYITVHLGSPNNTQAGNVRVKFVDYIKNVASSEIYSTWPTNALIANIHAIVTFALNRVYTEWYRSRAFSFDITNSTSYDMAFRYGGPVFDSISKLVDNIFNVYARRIGFRNPFFTQFCNGTTVTCAGLSQWGTVSLANQGMSPIQIMHYFYPDDLELVASNNITGIVESYPGYALRVGYQSTAIQRMQNYLNRIRANFPLIPRISNPSGYFGGDTENSVRAFQRTFNLTADGIIGRATWNKINFIYVGVIRLAELEGEGERVGLSPNPPRVTLSMGARGEYVTQLQFLLNAIAPYYSTIPYVIKDSIFDTVTKNSVMEFQKTFGLTPDGVVGPATWNKLYAVFRGIEENVKVPPVITTPSPTPPYPGTALRVGSSGPDVRLMQTYLNTIRIVYSSIPYLMVDSVFGPKTKDSVVAFQREFVLTPDGVIGPVTWDAIVRQFNIVSGR